jgi:1-acylglycerone phosphate reductase
MPLLDVDIDVAKKVYDVNVWGVVRTTQVFASLVIAAEGTIVIIGSIAGVMPYVFGGTYPVILLISTGAYNSSKAAVQSIADTLRIEMYPFNVKVINICTGGVKTNLSPKSISTYDLHLPADSVYMPIEQYFKKRQGFSNANAILAEVYAKQVVRGVNGARSGWLWKGYFANTCWFLSTFFWRTIFDIFMKRKFGLKELRNIVISRKKTQ